MHALLRGTFKQTEPCVEQEAAPQKGKGSSQRERETGMWPEEEQEVDVRMEEK